MLQNCCGACKWSVILTTSHACDISWATLEHQWGEWVGVTCRLVACICLYHIHSPQRLKTKPGRLGSISKCTNSTKGYADCNELDTWTHGSPVSCLPRSRCACDEIAFICMLLHSVNGQDLLHSVISAKLIEADQSSDIQLTAIQTIFCILFWLLLSPFFSLFPPVNYTMLLHSLLFCPRPQAKPVQRVAPETVFCIHALTS